LQVQDKAILVIADLARLNYFQRFAGAGHVLLRLFIGAVLVYGTQDNVFSHARMLEFRDFLSKQGFPYPLASAYLSAYAQFICGCLIFVGAAVRPAALIMIVNFIIALAMVHVRTPFTVNIAPMAMLVGSIFLLFEGAGAFSVDKLFETPRANAQTPKQDS
jgi:putative oxidoreductase